MYFQKGVAMKTKSGISVPADLAKALTENSRLLDMWGKLRPSCQKRHVEYLLEAVKPGTRQRRIETILKMTAEYNKNMPQLKVQTKEPSGIKNRHI
jgi:uncharacterized protein YdeI (YjbR/CyaY-like superfamily)